MSRLPNPFVSGQGNQQRTPQRPSTPGFLLMTRAPHGSNSFGGANYQSPAPDTESFIPFSNIGNNSSSNDNNRRNNNQGSARFNYSRGGGGGRHGNSPRFAYPYQQSPGPGGRMPSPRGRHGFGNTPGGRYNSNSAGLSYSTPRGNFNSTPRGNFNSTPGGRFHSGNHRGRFNDRHDRSYSDFNTPNPNGNSKGGWDRSRGRGPISSIPVDKFVSDNMVADPWGEFYDHPSDSGIQVAEVNPVVSLDNSEIIIDSDTSVLVENSFDEVVSDTEVDSSPVHDTGSDSPNIATSSTSEKDTGSDSGSDT